mmetsp:Transcript_15914/g.34659  ORF Transcript_15914/g.34659 Transcript_15914/m.34659 type:complete len:366 (+) Transcript_15914:148-1245(+)|eukprot:CAMPEP_0172534306 /NCGR_PEP_ID=MMETSP1067-20121228/6719_1 /TAXON_ID=265564 ORGANISM="Thalassiosira punctigera, Strain Tpunct2005C2" /NCGR_SAMPLE_ID=MMETSP1067 /ASSEMBLY_ACC=CAM_ASM_000444 /LENGTH=365 /DNA_ID=CAMNT_0013319083 /DNA_START=143 /DNA_END=1240 /DNA_ORIENTATION=+
MESRRKRDESVSHLAKEKLSANNGVCSATSTLELTEGEQHDNKVWQMRFINGDVFTQNYVPTWWETREMDAIVQFLELKKPVDDPESLDKDERAIGSIFFPGPRERKSVLLKRGPVFLGGEERELMLFTTGFVLSRIELESLVRLLFDASSPGQVKQLAPEELSKQFSLIDADCNGELDHSEIHDFFHGMGITLSEALIDQLIEKMDSDDDGKISLGEFKATMLGLQNQADGLKDLRSSWKKFRKTLAGDSDALNMKDLRSSWNGIRKSLAGDDDAGRLDLSFRMADVTAVMAIAEELAPLALAVYLKDVHAPLMVTCAKPGHVEAWEEAFNKCLQMQGGHRLRHMSSDKWHGSIDWGDDDDLMD